MGLSFLPGATAASHAWGVSADGSAVVGDSFTTTNNSQAFRWTSSGGMVGLGFLPSETTTFAQGISADGSVVVGLGCATPGCAGDSTQSLPQAFRWTSSGGMVGLGFLPGNTSSQALAASADGSVVVGDSVTPANLTQAFRWTGSGGMVGLGFLPGDNLSFAGSVSADGSVVVGASVISGGEGQAFRWTSSGGMVGLGFLPGGTDSSASGVSANGSVAVGSALSTVPFTAEQAFRWTSAGGMVGLGLLPGGTRSRALGVSADGSVVVGSTTFSPGIDNAFVWDATHGMRSLQQVLTGSGLELTGWTLLDATAVSADGSTIVGYGTDPSGLTEAWIATIPEPGTGLLALTGLAGLAFRRRHARATSVG